MPEKEFQSVKDVVSCLYYGSDVEVTNDGDTIIYNKTKNKDHEPVFAIWWNRIEIEDIVKEIQETEFTHLDKCDIEKIFNHLEYINIDKEVESIQEKIRETISEFLMDLNKKM